MPLTLTVGQTDTATAVESNSTDPNIPIPAGQIGWSSSNQAVFTVDAGTGNIVAIGVGQATITVTDVKYGISANDTIDVIAPPPTAIAITFSTPA
ncbi:MAG: Ig-like domain-containing protein [Patescibacteria group bacterium]|nr:Ig-like domain-containing protein [Patescibacteria group bacterium]